MQRALELTKERVALAERVGLGRLEVTRRVERLDGRLRLARTNTWSTGVRHLPRAARRARCPRARRGRSSIKAAAALSRELALHTAPEPVELTRHRGHTLATASSVSSSAP